MGRRESWARGGSRVQPFLHLICALSVALLLEQVALGQPAPPSASVGARPRIGLVLSGGGARGAAHIGVLEVLEDLRVPVDLVTGTSMGSIVGGLYAAGLSPAELGHVIGSVDWVRVFDDKPDRQDLSFRRKQDDRNFLTNLRLAFKDGSFFVPPGLVEGQKLDFLLNTLSLTSNGVARFEELRLPFRAVATDINTGEAVVLETGSLATAQRASMSIPGAFSPVELDGHLLVDGFVANNLPIDAAQGLGAQVVIAVDISTPLDEIQKTSSALAITSQVSGLATQENQRRQKERLGPGDVVITPELGDLGSASFTRMQEAIEAGRKAARASAATLSRYSISEQEYAEWRQHQRRPPQQVPVVDEVRIENNSLLADALVRERIHAREGEPLDLDVVQQDLARLYGLDAFERVQFDLKRENGRMVLLYHLDPRLRGRNYFRFGLNLETDFGNEATYNLGVNHVLLPLNSWGAEMRNYVQFGSTNRIQTELYQPLDPGDHLFVDGSARYDLHDIDIFQDDRRVARFDVESLLYQFNLGLNLGRSAQLQAGIGYLDAETDRRSGDPAQFNGNHQSGGLYGFGLEIDDLDNTRFPNDGEYAHVQALAVRRELGFDESFESFTSTAAIYRTFWRTTVGLGLRYDTVFDGGKGTQFLNSLGGFLKLSGFERDSISGPTVGLARLSIYRRIASPAVFAWEFPVYLGALLEVGNAWQQRDDIDDLRYSTGPFFGVDTPLGPLYLSYAYGEDGNHQGYLYLGQSF